MEAAKELALVMEITQGCRMSCKGCHVEKNGTGLPDDSVLEKLLTLLYDLKASGVQFAEIELGATDILSASNREAIFSHPLVAEIVRLFRVTVLNAAFVDPDPEQYIRLAAQVQELSPDNAVGLVTPMEITQAFNDKYIQRIRDNVTLFKEQLNNNFTEVIFSIVVDHHSLSRAGRKHSYSQLFARARELKVDENTAIDFAFHQGRLNTELPWVKEDFLQAIHALNYQYTLDLSQREKIERRHIPSQLLFEQEILELVFSNAELYIRPILNERLTVLHPSMRYDGLWQAQDVLRHFEAKTTYNQELAYGLQSCSACPHTKRCSNRYTQELMRLLNTQSCISLLPTQHGVLF